MIITNFPNYDRKTHLSVQVIDVHKESTKTKITSLVMKLFRDFSGALRTFFIIVFSLSRFKNFNFILVTILILFNLSAHAKSFKVYKHIDKNGVIHYSSKKPNNKNYKILNIRCPECAWKNKVNWNTTPLIANKFEKEIKTASKKWGVQASLIKAIIHAESSFKPEVTSSAGAQGLMQLMPATQKTYSVKDPYNPKQNILGGTAYLKHLLKKYKNNLKLSLAAYNAGESAVKKYDNNVPPYDETINYIKRVKILQKRYKKLKS